MIKYCKYLIWLYSGLCTFAVGQTEYAQWLKDQQREINAMVAEENEYLASVTQEFDNYVKDQERLFEEFKKEVEKKWDDFRFSSNKTYVDYDKDLNARGSVNFEKGEVEVEVIVEDDPAKSDKEKQKLAETKLKKKVTDLVQKKGEDDKALLKKQLQTTSGKEVSKQNAKSFSEEVIKEKKVTAKKIKSGDGKKRIL